MRIKTLKIECFRGIRFCEINLNGRSIVIKGANGLGKSSIVQAIEFLLSGKIRSLSHIQGLSLQNHSPHVHCKAEDLLIQLTFDPGNIMLRRTLSTMSTVPPVLSKYFYSTQQGAFLLQRSQVLQFIESQPGERFRTIGNIIGIEDLEKIEMTMMRYRDILGEDLKKLHEQEIVLWTKIEEYTQQERVHHDNILECLNLFLKEKDHKPLTSMKKVPNYKDGLFQQVKKGAGSDEIKALNDIIREVSSQIDINRIEQYLNNVNSIISEMFEECAYQKLSMSNLLNEGHNILIELKPEQCPLCEKEIDLTEVVESVEDRISILRSITEKQSILKQEIENLSDHLNIYRRMVNSICDSLAILPKTEELIEKLKKVESPLDFIQQTKSGLLYAVAQINIPIVESILKKIVVTLTDVKKIAESRLKEIKLSDEEKAILEVVNILQNVSQIDKEMDSVTIKLNISNIRFQKANTLYHCYSSVKKAEIQSIYDAIRSDIDRFYNIIHPGESHNDIQLSIVEGRRASTNLTIESFGRSDEDPRALCSEGHLDSLGLCIFLAFVKKFNVDCNLIILDDVVATVDAGHRDRICDLLMQEFNNYQFIILTHDSVWFNQLRQSQKFYSRQNEFMNCEIIDWDIESGPKIVPYKPQKKRIQDNIDAGDLTGAGNDLRKFLEYLLCEMCFITRVPLAMPLNRDSQYSMNDMFTGYKDRINKLVKDSSEIKFYNEAMSLVERHQMWLNILSHNNPLATQIEKTEVESFRDAIFSFEQVVICNGCGNFLIYDRSAKMLECRNPKCENKKRIVTK